MLEKKGLHCRQGEKNATSNELCASNWYSNLSIIPWLKLYRYQLLNMLLYKPHSFLLANRVNSHSQALYEGTTFDATRSRAQAATPVKVEMFSSAIQWIQLMSGWMSLYVQISMSKKCFVTSNNDQANACVSARIHFIKCCVQNRILKTSYRIGNKLTLAKNNEFRIVDRNVVRVPVHRTVIGFGVSLSIPTVHCRQFSVEIERTHTHSFTSIRCTIQH